MALLPVPIGNIPLFDTATGTINIQWQNFFNSLQTVTGTFAPIDARYWVSTSNADLTNETNIGSIATGYLKVTTAAGIATPSSVTTIPGTDITGAALTKTDDTNVTLTLAGSPATALLRASSLTLGWSGQLGLARGGTGSDLSATGGANQVLKQSTLGGAVTVGTLSGGSITGAALTKTDDTNVTLSLGGAPTTALLTAASLTLGWTGILGSARGGTANGFTKLSGPTTTEKTFTLPNASAAILTDNALVTVPQGGTGVATLTAHGVVVGAGASALSVTGTGTAGQVLTSNGSGANPTYQSLSSTGPWTLLATGSGTSTNASPTNVAAIAISGLTEQDTLRVLTNVESVTADTAGAVLYNNTDGVQCGYVANNGTITTTAGDWLEEAIIRPKEGDTTKITSHTDGGSANNSVSFVTGQFSFTTDWTGNWTLALRHGGVTATGTFKWRWTVYRQAGQ